jgi:hypothetical protein
LLQLFSSSPAPRAPPPIGAPEATTVSEATASPEGSAAWIAAEYNNQKGGSTFLSVGAEQPL